MSGMTLNGAGGQMAFGQPPTAMGGWAATGSGQTLSTQLWKWASVTASRQAQQETRRRAVQTIPCAAPDCDEVENWCPPPSRTSLQNMKLVSLSIFFLFPLSVSLSLYCVSESGVIQDHSLAVSAYHMVFLDHNFYFPFLEKNENNIAITRK